MKVNYFNILIVKYLLPINAVAVNCKLTLLYCYNCNREQRMYTQLNTNIK